MEDKEDDAVVGTGTGTAAEEKPIPVDDDDADEVGDDSGETGE